MTSIHEKMLSFLRHQEHTQNKSEYSTRPQTPQWLKPKQVKSMTN